MIIEFNSHTLPEKDRLDAAIDFYSGVGDVHIEPLEKEDFSCRSQLVALPRTIVIGAFECLACETTRTASHAAAGNAYDVLGIATGPEISVSQNGRDFTYGRGEAFLWRGDATGISRYSAPGTGFLNVALPTDWLRGALADMDAVAGQRLASTPQMRLLTNYVRAILADLRALPPEGLAIADTHIRDLVLFALGPTRDNAELAQGRGVRAARLKAIKDDIEAHLTDPNLSVAWVTARHKISERYLRALFADERASFSDFVMERRLAHVWRRITDPRMANDTIATLAYDAGFGDLSWFNRAFRRQFGMTPGDARESALRDRDENDA